MVYAKAIAYAIRRRVEPSSNIYLEVIFLLTLEVRSVVFVVRSVYLLTTASCSEDTSDVRIDDGSRVGLGVCSYIG
jgi:hypothetical protein